MKKSDRYIFVADSHIIGGEPEKNFFQLLKKAGTLPSSCGIVFLGDIFELWISLRRYENESHIRFREWCQTQKEIREIIFCEGNHEFYPAILRKSCFTEISRKDIRRGNLLFTHGDRINRKDIPYLLLRIGLRNPVTRFLLYLTGRAFGPALTHKVRLSLKNKNQLHKKDFPYKWLYRMMDRAGGRGISRIVLGHFHDAKNFERNGVQLYALPSFRNAGEIGILDKNQQYRCGEWRTLLTEE